MQEEYYCPKCGLQHRLVRHDTPETKVMCIQCGHRFAIKEASQQGVRLTENGRGESDGESAPAVFGN